MASEFEQSMSTIGGQLVTLTSWWDELAGTWRASVPGYTHLLSSGQHPGPACSTRGEAIRRLVRSLSATMVAHRAG